MQSMTSFQSEGLCFSLYSRLQANHLLLCERSEVDTWKLVFPTNGVELDGLASDVEVIERDPYKASNINSVLAAFGGFRMWRTP